MTPMVTPIVAPMVHSHEKTHASHVRTMTANMQEPEADLSYIGSLSDIQLLEPEVEAFQP